MKILNKLIVKDFCRLQKTTLKDLADINIIIGPNNCGKSSLLKSIQNLAKIEGATTLLTDKKICNFGDQQIWNKAFNNSNLRCYDISVKLEDNEFHNSRGIPEFKYYFEPSSLKGILEQSLGYSMDDVYRNVLKSKKVDSKSQLGSGAIENIHNSYIEMGFFDLHLKVLDHKEARLQNFSLLSIPQMTNAMKKRIVLCPDARLTVYNSVKIESYISSKQLDTNQYRDLMGWLKRIVDWNINTYKPDAKKLIMDSGFEATLDAQGSGVRSLICLLSDILSVKGNSIILIDEPELGLNPRSKQLFLNFIVNHAHNNQIFLATHDPTFINPMLLNRTSPDFKINIYLYSLINNNFIQVPLDIKTEVAGSFAGYLPHTTSYKDIHIYTEGRTDAQTIKEFLYKYLWKKNLWKKYEDRIGLYHFHGDFGKHILTTLPPHPFHKILIFDGDKKDHIKDIFGCSISQVEEKFPVILCTVDDLSENKQKKTKSKDKLGIIQNAFITGNKTLILFLKKKRIEFYTDSTLKNKNEGPNIAHSMTFKDIDSEFIILFDFICNPK